MKLLVFCLLTLFVSNSLFVKAEEEAFRSAILLVGVSANELAVEERGVLDAKKVIHLEREASWHQAIKVYEAQEIILKQPSGFVGLYMPNGNLVRPLKLVNAPALPVYQQQYVDTTVTHPSYDLGYATGGTRDRYRPQHAYSKDAKQLAPGWGYNRYKNEHKRTFAEPIFQFLSYSPVSLTTPFNYPASYNLNPTVSAAYGLGSLPHIGGLFVEMRNARENQERYNNLQDINQVPAHIEQPSSQYPVNSYERRSSGDPTNPISRDPNFYRLDPMPQAFNVNFPNYQNQANAYYNDGTMLPLGTSHIVNPVGGVPATIGAPSAYYD